MSFETYNIPTSGNDTLVGGDGNDTIDGLSGNDNISGRGGNDSLIGGFGNDNLFGEGGNDTLLGGDGADTLLGGLGDDSLDGGAGTFDWISYWTSASGVSVNLQLGVAIGEGSDVVFLVEYVEGSNYNDTIVGLDTLGGIFMGRFGADHIAGGFANDTIWGGSDNDSLFGGHGQDFVDGGDGDDFIDGGLDRDSLSGSIGDDTIIASLGDTVNGDAGIDVIDMTSLSSNITLDISGGFLQSGGVVSRVFGIEEFRFGSGNDVVVGAFGVRSVSLGAGNDWIADYSSGNNDVFSGGLGDDALYGRAGNDQLLGDSGNDILIGGLGNDSLDGGDGIGDRVSYWEAATAVSVNLQAGVATGEGTDSIVNVEGAEGSNFNDTIIGLNDVGGLLSGLSGADSIMGGAGNDTLSGGAGDDTLNGGAGTGDRVSYRLAAGAVSVNLQTGLAAGEGVDVLLGIEGAEGSNFADTLLGSGGGDTLEGGSGNDELSGRAGNDRLSGDAGNDILIGGLGNDTLDGGAGLADRVSYWEAASGVNVNLQAGVATGEGTDTILNVEEAEGSSFNDTLVGLDIIGSLLSGLAGADSIMGGANNDTLSGGLGDDTLVASVGDTVLGGDGIDLLDLTNSSTNLTVDIAGNIYQSGGVTRPLESVEVLRLGSGNDVVISALEVRSVDLGAGNDWISDNSWGNNDSFFGGDGNDTLYGRVGNDLLQGGAGDDILLGGFNDDILDGGAGLADRVSYSEALSGVNVNLQFGRAGGEGTDTIQNVEGAEGSNFNDTLVGLDSIGGLLSGLAGADSITGGAGNDTLIGGAGDDTLIGNGGDDSVVGGVGDNLFGGDGIDVADLTSLTVSATVDTANAYVLIGGAFRTLSSFEDVRMGSGNDVFIGGSGLRSVDLGAGNDWIADYSSGNNDVFFGGLGDDALYGRAGNDRLSGDAGDDILIGGLGNDTLDGGAGSSDRVSYWEAASGVSVNLQAGVATGEGTDSILNVEGAEGSSFNDTLVGLDSIGSLLSGLAGADNIMGGAGNDTLSGGLGDDTLNGGAGFGDRISYRAAAGAVSVNLQTGLAAGEGADVILNVEEIEGSDFADTLTGGGGNDFFDGGRGSDVIAGGAGIDTASWVGVTANLVGNAAQGVLGDGIDFDSVSEIEVWRLGSGNDIFVGWFGTRQVWLGGGNDWIADYSPGNNDMFYGEAGNDALYGLGGDDMLVGGDGTDILIGGLGNDTLVGDTGFDWMQGGAGADTFVFTAVADAAVAAPDAVSDFTRTVDRINLAAIDANVNIAGDQAFTVVSAFTAVAGQLRVQGVGSPGHPAVVSGDVNGDGVADFAIYVYLAGGETTLTGSDFIL